MVCGAGPGVSGVVDVRRRRAGTACDLVVVGGRGGEALRIGPRPGRHDGRQASQAAARLGTRRISCSRSPVTYGGTSRLCTARRPLHRQHVRWAVQSSNGYASGPEGSREAARDLRTSTGAAGHAEQVGGGRRIPARRRRGCDYGSSTNGKPTAANLFCMLRSPVATCNAEPGCCDCSCSAAATKRSSGNRQVEPRRHPVGAGLGVLEHGGHVA